MLFNRHKPNTITADRALKGRDRPIYQISGRHTVLGTNMAPPFPDGIETAVFALGCFWGAERLFWRLPGVYTTAVGYAGGFTPNPTYEEACSTSTGHAESVLVAYDPEKVTYNMLLKTFFESHDPTQGNRQGNDVGPQYRSAIYYTTEEQKRTAEMALEAYNEALQRAGRNPVTTELAAAGPFYYAEEDHQQYLHKVPNGYCGLAGTGVECAIPTAPVAGGAEVSDPAEMLPTNEDEWRKRLSPEQYQVLRQAGTERAFTGKYTDVEDDGMYKCAACGNQLFDSATKFHSGSGWPSFTEAISPDAVELIDDSSHGMRRTEVCCARCHSHLGHVFDDGPRDRGGQRYCMNSISMDLEQR